MKSHTPFATELRALAQRLAETAEGARMRHLTSLRIALENARRAALSGAAALDDEFRPRDDDPPATKATTEDGSEVVESERAVVEDRDPLPEARDADA